MSAATNRLIFAACKALGLDDEARHDLQLRVTGKASLADMTPREREAVVAELKRQGFRPEAAKGRRPAAPRGDLRLAHALWGKLARGGAVEKAGAAGLSAFVRARFGAAWGAEVIDIDRMQDAAQIAAVVQALKAMCRRAGIDTERSR